MHLKGASVFTRYIGVAAIEFHHTHEGDVGHNGDGKIGVKERKKEKRKKKGRVKEIKKERKKERKEERKKERNKADRHKSRTRNSISHFAKKK